ncbi:MAG: hypothetical protein ABSF95_19600 [Verrucomicrobiota bacterium]|jgi:preprotein translocase subunit SecD
MMISWNRFNVYWLLALPLTLICACRSAESKSNKALSTLRLFLEVNPDGTGRNRPVPIYRDKPFMVNVETEPFLTEANVSEARVIEAVGGFAMRIRLDRRGSWLFEQYTVANRGKRYAIFSQFHSPLDPKSNQARWLGAPVISARVSDGVLVFTPDASREEASQIVRGLNHVARKNANTPDKQSLK